MHVPAGGMNDHFFLLLGMNMVLVVLVIIITAQIRIKLLKACFVMTSRMFEVDRNKHFIDKDIYAATHPNQ